ncbi:MALECTIN/RECEPTOR-LIKE KINASE FAMILY PROTEIN [Salix viminalis]|uniref:MALECTIN/RECEPTOR-LIKE KINASE FAMILY PROTEIN n=1 Tax=Salix viminalis TaxID=40686 RepID=A0A9Q0YYU7_SALVM|nr:MALECTIN/RECEPTOR-LIKE KINASE FAMILY PROTEIN [Salix viminalis]
MCNALFNDIGSGPCGFNSYCSIQENGTPTCDCPPGYVFLDLNNRLGGCKPTFPQGCGLDDGCGDPEELYEIRQVDNVNWPLNDYERLSPYSQTQCEKSCLYDCSCAVAIFDGRQCWKKRLPLSNGRYMDTGFSKTLFKVRREVPPPGYCKIGSGSTRRERKVKKAGPDSSISCSTLRCFTYKELEEATGVFKEELGRGSSGIVYKGIMGSSSRNAIAVKKLGQLAQERERGSKTEVSAIGQTHH